MLVLDHVADIDLGVDWDLVSPFTVEAKVEIVKIRIDLVSISLPLDLHPIINSSLATTRLAHIVAPLIGQFLG